MGCSEPTFVTDGFHQWKNATGDQGKFAKHAKSRMHLLAFERLKNFKHEDSSIDVLLAGQAEASRSRREEERTENREIVKVIFDVVCHLALQNSSFCGQDETEQPRNPVFLRSTMNHYRGG